MTYILIIAWLYVFGAGTVYTAITQQHPNGIRNKFRLFLIVSFWFISVPVAVLIG